jgi:hypothetical protein
MLPISLRGQPLTVTAGPDRHVQLAFEPTLLVAVPRVADACAGPKPSIPFWKARARARSIGIVRHLDVSSSH